MLRTPLSCWPILLVCCSWAAPSGGQELPLAHFTSEHQRVPMPSSSVQTVFQDELGFIWMGFFSSGLARYDGRELETFGMADGLLDATVREVFQDRAGFLWVGSETGVVVSDRPLAAYAPGERPRFRSQVGPELLVQTRIRHTWMAPDPGGGVWVATAGLGLRHYRLPAADRLETRDLPLDPPGERLEGGASLTARRDGTLWVGLERGPVGYLPPRGARLVWLPGQDGPACRQITALHEGPTGTLWAGCRNGTVVRLVDGPDLHFETVSSALSEQISSLLETPEGDLWATSLGSGILRLDGGDPTRAHVFGRRNGLLSETVWHVLRDREGNLWLPNNAGCSRLRPDYPAFEHYTGRARVGELAALPDPTVFAVVPPSPSDRRRVIWVGTGGGLAAISDHGRTGVLGVGDGLLSGSIYSLTRDDEGRIWIGTLGGLNVLSFGAELPVALGRPTPRHVKVLGRTALLAGYRVGTVYGCRFAPIAASPSDATEVPAVWIVGTGGVSVWTDGAWYLLRMAAGVPAAGAVASMIDPEGFVYVVTKDSGILRSARPVTRDTLRELVPARASDREIAAPLLVPWWNRTTGAPSHSLHDLIWAGDRMWVGSAVGLIALSGSPPRIFDWLDADHGLGGNHVMGMAVEPRTGTLWVTQNAGITELEPLTGRVLRRVSTSDGLIDNEAWGTDSSLAIDERGTIYFATPKGLTLYHPSLDHEATPPPLLRLLDASVSEDRSGHNEVSLHWAALSFVDETGIRYRTRLRGFSDDWSAPSGDVKLRYTNLPAFLFPVHYTFEVIAVNHDGLWTPAPLRWTFSVRPPWWATWWAVVAAAALLGAAIHITNRLRTVRLERRTRELEDNVAARTSEIRAYAQELETLDRIVATINREVDFEDVMETLLEQGLVLLAQARRGAFLLGEPGTDNFRVAASHGWDPRQVGGITFTAGEAMARFRAPGDRVAEGIAVVRDLDHRPGAVRVHHLPTGRTVLAVDLPLDEQIAGFLIFDLEPAFETLDAAELEALQRYRQHAITALHKARTLRQLERTSRAAEQASRAKSAFLATMSHELRTPLNSIIGFSEILLRKLGNDSDPRVARFLTNILTSGQHLLALINDILDLSKIEAGRMVLELEACDPAAIIDGVCRIAHGMAAKRRLEIVQEVEPDLPVAMLDSGRLKQVLFNLLSNAVKFSADGSQVTVRARLVPAARSPLSRRSLELTVSDHGIGIAPDQLERVFDEFHQVDSGIARRFQGSGLGLALVRRFTGLMGGRVTVKSRVGEGSTFTLLLPADPPEAEPDAPTAAWPAVRTEPEAHPSSPQRHRDTEPPPTRD
jgi:signal transduction histidine kinase/ligand-binding sensor domain-containing protein